MTERIGIPTLLRRWQILAFQHHGTHWYADIGPTLENNWNTESFESLECYRCPDDGPTSAMVGIPSYRDSDASILKPTSRQ